MLLMHLVVDLADSDSDNEATDEEEEWTAISYQAVCETLDIPLGGTKLNRELRARLQTVDTAHVELGEAEPIEVTTNYVSYSILSCQKLWHNIKG